MGLGCGSDAEEVGPGDGRSPPRNGAGGENGAGWEEKGMDGAPSVCLLVVGDGRNWECLQAGEREALIFLHKVDP